MLKVILIFSVGIFTLLLIAYLGKLYNRRFTKKSSINIEEIIADNPEAEIASIEIRQDNRPHYISIGKA